MQELKRGSESLAAGSYGFKVYNNGSHEGDDLVRAFNQMSDTSLQITPLEEDRQQLA